MDRTRSRIYSEKEQTDILRSFVDAIVAAQDVLVGADAEEWDDILRSSFREQRETSDEEAGELLAVC